jgi:hypothetical protein
MYNQDERHDRVKRCMRGGAFAAGDAIPNVLDTGAEARHIVSGKCEGVPER